MNKFENISTTNVCVKRNALKRELHLNGESNSDIHNKRLQREIGEHQAEIERRERAGE